MSKILSYLFGLLLCLYLTSCGFYEDYMARKHLHPDSMKIILFELYVADEINAGRILKDSSINRKKENLKSYDQIFKNHHISETHFFNSLDYYLKRPKLFSTLTDSLNNHAQRMIGKQLNLPYKNFKEW
ncbi:MAG: DUF4296 domain-containing protein [Bacteroidota bacterium]|jgi:hypothetical protein